MVLTKKYKGNTLPEVLIAIVIITFISALGVTIYLNIQQNSQPFIKLKASELAAKYIVLSQQQRSYFDEQLKEEEFLIKKTITRLVDYPDCMLLKVTVYNSLDKKLSESFKIIYATN